MILNDGKIIELGNYANEIFTKNFIHLHDNEQNLIRLGNYYKTPW